MASTSAANKTRGGKKKPRAAASRGQSSSGSAQPRILRELFALALLFVTLFMIISVVSYHPADPSMNNLAAQGYKVRNSAGVVGSYLGGLLVEFFGVGAYGLLLILLLVSAKNLVRALRIAWWRWLGLALSTLCVSAWAAWPWFQEHVALGLVQGGGLVGNLFMGLSRYYLRPLGSALLWICLGLAALQLSTGVIWSSLGKHLQGVLRDFWLKHLERWERWRRHRLAKHSEAGERERTERPEPVQTRPERSKRKQRDDPLEDFIKEEGAAASVSAPPPENEERAPEPAIPVYSLEETPEDEAPWDEGDVDEPIPPVEPMESEISNAPLVRDEVDLSGEDLTEDAEDEDDGLFAVEPQEKPVARAVPKSTPAQPPAAPAAPRPRPRPVTELVSPSTDLLQVPDQSKTRTPREILEAQARRLVECLADFGVQGLVQGITPGPVVTMFEYKPAPGVKISKIANLSDDLKMSLKAQSVRIEAPIPGTDAVGIEIPTQHRETVYLRDILEAECFTGAKSLLTLALGKDIAGRPQVADLARMPHLLVAGATGTGKSVCLNSLLMSMLYKAKPDQVRLLLVDPKRIELAVYADLPHLVHPVVTDMSMAKGALDWAVAEMDKRYDALARMGVRNIEGYNNKLRDLGANRPDELADLEHMPFLVIIIDELADLMLTAAKEVETSIVRLAQLARAAGIHLILATQRPSVDVVTGLIKANFPCRISFQVPSKHDSRTILDTTGAEYLLGWGDMLFKPSGGKLKRMHGALVTDDEVAAVVEHWKNQKAPDYAVDFSEWQNDGKGEGAGMDGPDMSGDPVYPDAVDFVMSQGKASISLIQRRFRIGFNRAARFIEQMEMDGVIGPADGSKPRVVLRNKE